MQWLLKDLVDISYLDYLAQIHDGDSISHVTSDSCVMCDK
jgi:hypothetical protein